MLSWFLRVAAILAAPVALAATGYFLGGGATAQSSLAHYCAQAMFYGGSVALAAALVNIVYSIVGAQFARRSRDLLLTLFSFGRSLTPFTMAIAALGVGVGAIGGLGWLTTQFHFNAHSLINLGILAVAVAGGVFVGARAFIETLRAFRVEPNVQFGREATPQMAPELWSLLRGLAKHVGAPVPDAIVVGLLGGPFVTACEMRLVPEGRMISGRILYLPLPTLLVLDIAQLSAVLTHELAHFSGEDAEYSLRLAPSYAAMGRSIATLVVHDSGHWAARAITYPAISQLLLFTTLFDHAVNHWSRERELWADRISGVVIGEKFAASALARYVAFAPVVETAVDSGLQAPDKAADDLVAEIAAAVKAAGAQDPRPHLEERTQHPTDTHPAVAVRVQALGQRIDDAFLAEAGAAAPSDFTDMLDLFFVDAAGLTRQLTADLLKTAATQRQATISALSEMAQARVETRAYFETLGLAKQIELGVAWSITVLGVILILAGLYFLPKVHQPASAMTLLKFGVATFLIAGAYTYWRFLPKRRRNTPFLETTEDACRFVDADLTLRWRDIETFQIADRAGLVATFTLSAAAPAPKENFKRERVSYDARTRVLTLTANEIRDCDLDVFANSIVAAHRAAVARNMLGKMEAMAAA